MPQKASSSPASQAQNAPLRPPSSTNGTEKHSGDKVLVHIDQYLLPRPPPYTDHPLSSMSCFHQEEMLSFHGLRCSLIQINKCHLESCILRSEWNVSYEGVMWWPNTHLLGWIFFLDICGRSRSHTRHSLATLLVLSRVIWWFWLLGVGKFCPSLLVMVMSTLKPWALGFIAVST